MRRLTTLLLAGLMLGLAAGPAAANPKADHPGCKGIEQALSKANTKGKTALQDVAAKLDCGTLAPEPDPAACAAGTSLGRWTYTGTYDGPPVHGYPTWQDSVWTNVTGATAAWVEDPHNEHTNGGGFYWGEAIEGSVDHLVLVSFTGERVTVDPELLPTRYHPISQNHFVDRTGINHVNFCGQ